MIDRESLEELLSRPTPGVLQDLGRAKGDLLILGAGGKMGPTLTRMARRAWPAEQKVTAVSIFSSDAAQQELERQGVRTIAGDLLDDSFLSSLPDAENIIYMAGFKFGSTENPAYTWAMNTLLPALVSRRFPSSRIVAFSTGNVYPFVKISSGGCEEQHPTGPIGEYAQSCLGRERMLQYHSLINKTPMTIVRLNYAVEPRYGVLTDIAGKVRDKIPIDATMGYFNCIWQRDANAHALRALSLTESPAQILNSTGMTIYSVRNIAEQFGEMFGVKPLLIGQEADTALLSSASKVWRLFDPPTIELTALLEMIHEWLNADQPLLNKPTHFEQRDGAY